MTRSKTNLNRPGNVLPSTPRLLTSAETAELLRVSRRTVEELGKAYDRGVTCTERKAAPPSGPQTGLRRTWITPRKCFYFETDIREYLLNCRRDMEGLEPISIACGVEIDGPNVPHPAAKGD